MMLLPDSVRVPAVLLALLAMSASALVAAKPIPRFDVEDSFSIVGSLDLGDDDADNYRLNLAAGTYTATLTDLDGLFDLMAVAIRPKSGRGNGRFDDAIDVGIEAVFGDGAAGAAETLGFEFSIERGEYFLGVGGVSFGVDDDDRRGRGRGRGHDDDGPFARYRLELAAADVPAIPVPGALVLLISATGVLAAFLRRRGD